MLLSGCGDESKSVDESNERVGSQPRSQVKAAVLDYDGLMQLVASKKGKFVVIDCWALW